MERNSVAGPRAPRAAKIASKLPAPVQITAEQLLREAHERQEAEKQRPKQKITDETELAEYRGRKRREFEDTIRRNRQNIGCWLRYAFWEESQAELERARSIYERAVDVDHRSIPLWLKYAEMEMRTRNINHARNVWDRAVAILPRVDQFWYKYTYMEEALNNVVGARQIFERWMEWRPDEQAWLSYVRFERRYGENERARQIMERYVQIAPSAKAWLKYAKLADEISLPIETVRAIYERAVASLGTNDLDEKLLMEFARLEIRQRNFDRARSIFKFGLEHLKKHQAEQIYQMYTQFEKQHGDRQGIEDVIVGKRRHQYEEEIRTNPRNYDVWFDYARLEENNGDVARVREVYERAIAQVPLVQEKRMWRRYIYLWINYALFEELVAEDRARAREVYKACLQVIPHKLFTFAKIWLLYAKFEIRSLDLQAARKALGLAIGTSPKEKLFKGYIQLELDLREFDRCRKLYAKYLEYNPSNCAAWIKFAELERSLGDTDRARAIFEIAIAQPLLDMPELLWKAYIDFEFGLEEYDNTRQLYQRLLERTEHVKVWVSFANFEATIPILDEHESLADLDSDRQSTLRDALRLRIERARGVYQRGYDSLKRRDAKEERVILLEAWREFEKVNGSPADLEKINAKMPRKIKKRREITDDNGKPTGWEEYFEYIFPDDKDETPILKFLAMANMWKMQQQRQEGDDEENADESGEQGEGEDDEAGDDDNDENEAKRENSYRHGGVGGGDDDDHEDDNNDADNQERDRRRADDNGNGKEEEEDDEDEKDQQQQQQHSSRRRAERTAGDQDEEQERHYRKEDDRPSRGRGDAEGGDDEDDAKGSSSSSRRDEGEARDQEDE